MSNTTVSLLGHESSVGTKRNRIQHDRGKHYAPHSVDRVFFSSSIYMPVSSLFTEKWSNYRRMWVTVRIYTHWGFPWTGDTDLLTGAYTCAGVTLWLKYTQYLVVLNTQVSPEFLSRTFSSRFPSKAFSTLVWTLESVPRTELGLVIVAGLYLNTHVPS